jgi:uncharacterized UBP type Zn finger protein
LDALLHESGAAITGAHVAAGTEQHGRLLVRAHDALFNLQTTRPRSEKKNKKKKTKKNNDNKIELKERNHGEIIEDVYTLVRVVMGSLQTRHFLTRGAQAEQQLT